MKHTSHAASNRLFIITVFLALSFTLFGMYAVYRHRPPPISPKELLPQTTQIKIESPSIFFATDVFLKRDKTFISLPYQLSNPPHTLWLTLQTPKGVPPINRLIYHPTVAQLDWPYVEDQGIRLYQKTKKYSSLTEFNQNLPTKETVLADPQLLTTAPYTNLKNGRKLPDDPAQINLDQIDYFLTTYTQSREAQDYSFYETTLDATSAFVTPENKLNWMISAPFASTTNPLYIGDIHVDYRQF